MRRFAPLIVLTFILFLAAMGTSNNDRVELEERLYALAMSVDYGGQDRWSETNSSMLYSKVKVQIEVGIWKNLGTPTSPGSSSPAKPSWQLSGEGRTLSGAIESMEVYSYRPIALRHLGAVVLGKEIAEKRPGQVAYFVSRSPEILGTLQLVVTKGKGSDVVKVQPTIDRLVGPIIPELIDKEEQQNSLYHTTLEDFVYGMSSGDVVFLPVITPARKAIKVAGLAVFANSRLAGWLNINEVREIAWLHGSVITTLIDFPEPINEQGIDHWARAFRVTDTHTRYRVTDVNDKPKIVIDILCEGDLTEEATGATDDKRITRDNLLIAGVIKKEMNAGLELSKRGLKKDIIGLSEELQRYHPMIWGKYESKCRKDFFSTVDVSIGDVKVNIRRVGLLR